ncbi:hypothetical protein ACCC84_21935 [Serratia odorifera]|uniref:hypothetical protein n=1 Tax=Serratia odorifera TaxID=618 RepID=UPI0035323512
MKLEGRQPRSYTDVIAYAADPVFSHTEVVIASLAADLVPGNIIDATGALYAASSTDEPMIVISNTAAGANRHVLVVDRGVIVKRSALIAADVAGLTAALAKIKTSGKVRFSVN